MAKASTPITLSWSPEWSTGHYTVYRGSLATLSLNGNAPCLESGLTATSTTDGDLPAAATGFYYLVTAVNRLFDEGTLGYGSGGERTNVTLMACP